MEQEDVSVLQALRLVSLDSPNTSSPGDIIHTDTHLNPLTPHQDAAPYTDIDTEPALQRENAMETPLELSQEQRNNTDNSITNVTSTIQQDKTSNIQDTTSGNDLDNGNVASSNSAQQTDALLHHGMSAVAVETPTSSNVDNKPQVLPPQESAPSASNDFTQTTIRASL
ncbi:hypothetical protein BGZ89_011002, partial [Linnemannia elongata]